jgi:hypothetical protein
VRSRQYRRWFKMIDLHERLSEFSFGYGVTREVEGLLASVGLHPTPFLPSLLHEGEVGFDVKFEDPGRVVVLQFKLGEELGRFHRATPSQSIPFLARPFWRYRIDTTGHQFQLLVDYESRHSDVYYVAPRFSTWQAYERAFQDRTVLENSLMLKPSEISRGITAQAGLPGIHRVVYDRVTRYVCSDPVELQEQRPLELANEIARKIRATETSLHHQIEHLVSRSVTSDGPGRIDPIRRERLYERAKRPIDAMAAIVGIEAWSQGAQVLFVSA